MDREVVTYGDKGQKEREKERERERERERTYHQHYIRISSAAREIYKIVYISVNRKNIQFLKIFLEIQTS